MTINKDEIWKYVYWLDDNSLAELQKQMKAKGTDMVCAQYSPCEAMRGDIGYAEPHIWPVLCKPDATPWYTQSKYRGKHLVVSSFPLDKEYEQLVWQRNNSEFGYPNTIQLIWGHSREGCYSHGSCWVGLFFSLHRRL